MFFIFNLYISLSSYIGVWVVSVVARFHGFLLSAVSRYNFSEMDRIAPEIVQHYSPNQFTHEAVSTAVVFPFCQQEKLLCRVNNA